MKTATASAATVRAAIAFKNILFATDFSPAAAHAIPYVQKIARHYEAKLAALHVRTPVLNPMTEPATWDVYLKAAQAEDDQHRAELLAAFPGIPTEVVIEEGSITSCLQQTIARTDTDLLVIGTRGRTGLAKLLLGSVAEEMFRTVACPVLTVGPRVNELEARKGEFREILYATDFSPESMHAAAYAVSLAEEFQARLTLLHVIPRPAAGDLVSANDVAAAAEKLLRQIVPPEAQARCKPEYLVVQGDPADNILGFAILRALNLIVLGVRKEHGLPGAANHLPMAIAHKIVAHAACPVLTVRH